MAGSIITRGISVLTNHGPTEFIRRARAFGQRKYGTPAYWFSKLRGEQQVTVGKHSISVGISSYLGDYGEIRFFERNEKAEMLDILSELGPDDVFLDIGANIGIHSLFANQVAKQVYAIEPHPTNSSYLLRNIELNTAGVKLFQCALSDTKEYIGLVGERGKLDADGSVSLADSESDRSSSQLFARAERGDDLIKQEQLQHPSVIKIDVEGAECLVIDGLAETLQRLTCRVVYCEVHEREVEYETVVSKLDSLGFDSTVVDKRDYGRTIKARKRRSTSAQ